MQINIIFILTNMLLGVGLAMDAFSVSMANGLNDPHMKRSKMNLIAGTFCGFQILMPLIGWVCVHTVLQYFKIFEKFIPWIALILLALIGGKMVVEGIRGGEEDNVISVGLGALMVQGIATSIDALSVGFTIAEYEWYAALLAAVIIGIVTFVICMTGLFIGRKFGTKLAGKASVLGGCILIAIGLEIFISGMIG